MSGDILPGQVLSKRFMGEPIVMFRTEKGALGVLDAYCPHLGAHLGHGGRVQGESIRCPFHGFCFDKEGSCTATGYGTKPPPKARSRTWKVEEKHGVILAWYDAQGRAPTWHVPAYEMEGWSPFHVHYFHLRGHPQETTENSVDIGHFSWVHGYEAVEQIGEPVVEGPYMGHRYSFAMPLLKVMGKSLNARQQIRVHVWGLGYSAVEVEEQDFGIDFRLMVLPAPIDGNTIDLRVALSLRDFTSAERVNRLLRVVPDKLSRGVLPKLLLKIFAGEIERDFDIWNNKRYVEAPALASGDGPVGLYRRWAKQFYEGPPQ